MQQEKDETQQKISSLARKVLSLSHDGILMNLRFLDLSLSELHPEEKLGLGCMATDGKSLLYDPVFVLKLYQESPNLVTRYYLHILMHCIFSHDFAYEKMDPESWNLAVDIAAEAVVLELGVSGAMLETDDELGAKLRVLKEDAGLLTAEKIYHRFRLVPPSRNEKQSWYELTHRDEHTLWKPAEEMIITQEEWKKISERVKAEIKSFSNGKIGSETLEKNLDEGTRDRYDYSAILSRFTVMGEDLTINEDEFDLVYYTYGLQEYGNLPLIEPLEYKENNKVREFVIAIDTSASCRGEIVKGFLQKTYSLLKSSENFFHKVNIHILQVDSAVQSDTKVTDDEDFDNFIKYRKLKGFGSTDFRPAFEYVDELKAKGEFENLKGLIYFTDGYGIYPEKMPDYDVIFAFLDEDENRGPVPSWSMKVVLETDELEQVHQES